MQKPKLDVENPIKTFFRGIEIFMPPNYKELDLSMGYEKLSLGIFENLLEPGSVFVDVGTHVGFFSVIAGTKVGPRGKVYSFEPIPENVKVLKKNIALNKLKNVEVINQPLSSEAGSRAFKIREDTGLSGFYEHPLGETVKEITVETSTLDDHFKDKKVDFIKIDTEGHELDVLEGGRQTLKNNPDAKIMLELNPGSLEKNGKKPEELLNFLAALGYELYAIDDLEFSAYRLTDRVEKWRDVFPSYGYANILCLPKKDHHYALFVCHSSDPGGAELALIEHVEGLRKRNILSHVVIPAGGGIEEQLRDKGIGYSKLKYTFWSDPQDTAMERNLVRNQINIEASAAITQLAQTLNVQLIVNNTIVCPWGYPAAKSLGLPLAWLIHEYGDLGLQIPFFHPIADIRRFIVEQSDLVIANSNAIKKAMLQAKKNDHTEVVYNSLDYEAITRLSMLKAPAVFTKKADIRLSMVGRVQHNKQQHVAIRAVAELKRRGINAELDIIGPAEKDYGAKIEKEIASLGLTGQVKLLGFQGNPHSLVAQSDIALVCAIHEGFGRITAEAMIIGKPVIGADSGGTTEMIKDGVSGLLFKPGDATELADKIEQLRNKELRKKLTQNAAKRIIGLIDKDKNADRLSQLIRDIDYSKDRSYDSVFTTEWIDGVSLAASERMVLSAKVAEDQSRIEQLEQSNNDLAAAKAALETQRDELLNSKSWKVTKPLRGAAAVAGKTKRGTKKIINAPADRAATRKEAANASQIYQQNRQDLAKISKSSQTDTAVMLHLYYPEMWQAVFVPRLMNLEKIPFDLFVTMPTGNEDFVETIKNDFSGAHVFEVPNWGRDVLPFLETATGVAELGYKYILKIHSKKSPQISQLKAQSKRFARVAEGRDWLTDILSKLMPDELGAVEEIMQKLQDPDTGVIGPAGHYIALPVGEQSWKVNKANLQKIVTQVFGKPTAQKISQSPWDYGLFQGTMFWARLDSLAPIFAAGFSVNNFEPERGQTDGTLAHAMERAFCLTPELIDKKMYEASKEGVKKIAYKTTKVPVWSEFYQP